jgi:(p)ppGpp synthase/HD superfamily hydrolase
LEDISRQFGPKVANIVSECTDNKSLGKTERKRLQIVHAREISKEAKLVKLADKLSNLSDLENKENRPKGWTDEVVKGYFLWGFFVCREMKGTCSPIEDELWAIFKRQGILDMSSEVQNEELEKYYNVI